MSSEQETLVLDDGDRTIVEGPPARVLEAASVGHWQRGLRFLRAKSSYLKPLASVLVIVGIASWMVLERRRAHALLDALEPPRGGASVPSVHPQRTHIATTSVDGGSPARSSRSVMFRNDHGHAGNAKEERAEPSLAADLIAQNRYEEALVLYRRLAAERSADPVYSDVVFIIEARLACRDGLLESGSECSE